MRRFADIGAAVIGTGFIGTVHAEALRRIGVDVRGVLGSTPDRGAARAAALNVPKAYGSLDEILADATVDVAEAAGLVTGIPQLIGPEGTRTRLAEHETGRRMGLRSRSA